MSRELAEVRRYWPRAVTMVAGQWYTAAGLKADLYHIGQVWQVTITTPGSAYRRHCQPTIAAAMRAAGFGVRPLGEFARAQHKRAAYRKLLMDSAALGPSWAAGAAKLLAYYQPVLTITQRPRKGARLGQRKRTGWDKEETRRFAQWREWEGRP